MNCWFIHQLRRAHLGLWKPCRSASIIMPMTKTSTSPAGQPHPGSSHVGKSVTPSTDNSHPSSMASRFAAESAPHSGMDLPRAGAGQASTPSWATSSACGHSLHIKLHINYLHCKAKKVFSQRELGCLSLHPQLNLLSSCAILFCKLSKVPLSLLLILLLPQISSTWCFSIFINLFYFYQLPWKFITVCDSSNVTNSSPD